MFIRCCALFFAAALVSVANAQGIMGDVFSGKLIDPQVGVYSWYDLTDTSTGKQFYLRLAIVGEEKVKGKTGYWLEVELLPRVGFPAVYKMLLTGPASDPNNVHRIVMKEGTGEPVEMDTATLAAGAGEPAGAKREVIGEDEVPTQIGTVIAEHVVVTENETQTDIWLNDEIRPMGLVKITNSQGVLVLRNYGEGGQHAQSAFERPVLPPPPGAPAEPVNAAPEIEPPADPIYTITPPAEEPAGEPGEAADPAETSPAPPDNTVAPAPEMPQETAPADDPASINAQKDNSGKEDEKEDTSKRRQVKGFGGRPR